MTRQIVLDTETTGLEPKQGHRIIEIGCVELVDRRLTGNNYHQYINPDREVDEGAVEVHGLDNDFLADKPLFADIVSDFVEYIRGAELIIHNAAFDVGFINHELKLLDGGWGAVKDLCGVLDTLGMARHLHPGQKNSLDALCRRYEIDNSHRELHGALLDAEILADVYLLMTGGQVSLSLEGEQSDDPSRNSAVDIRRLDPSRPSLRIVRANDNELSAHSKRLDALDKSSGGQCFWRELEQGE